MGFLGIAATTNHCNQFRCAGDGAGAGGSIGDGGGGNDSGGGVCPFILSTQGAPSLILLKHVILDFIGNFNESLCLTSWQAFYPVEHPVDVSFGDILAARCVFTGEGRTEATHIGYESTNFTI